jgi:hypothetical protein
MHSEYGAAPLIEWLIATILFVIPAWRILGKAGFPPALALLMIVPLLGNICVFVILAFAEWPALKRRTPAAIASTFE